MTEVFGEIWGISNADKNDFIGFNIVWNKRRVVSGDHSVFETVEIRTEYQGGRTEGTLKEAGNAYDGRAGDPVFLSHHFDDLFEDRQKDHTDLVRHTGIWHDRFFR